MTLYNLTAEEHSAIMTTAGTRERRWIILAEDGRHATIGRHTDPTGEELERAASALRASGQGGWLAVTEGQYYRPRDRVTLIMVRELTPTRTPLDAAVAAFQATRRQAVAPARARKAG